VALSGLVVFGVVAVGCSPSDAASTDGDVVPGATTTGEPEQTISAGPAATAAAADALLGFAYPLRGACLPQGDQLMPNAPRPYRNGIHEGIDFYQVDNCTAIGLGTEVLAAKQGRVVRADLDYHDLTAAELQQYSDDPTTEVALDVFRGRQVWLEHEGGVVTRYAHLSGIAPGIEVGKSVVQGEVVGYVGESGTPESLTNPGHEYHLHFEVRTAAAFLGDGLPPAEVRSLYHRLFGDGQ
jgi:murein DD-endopeptidase MepM/ murein hydrolase activator NlpD